MFDEAISLDPNFLWPYVYSGWSRIIVAKFAGWSKSPSMSIQKAFEFATKAIAIDDSYDAAHSLLGDLYLYKGRYDKATQVLRNFL